MYSYEFCEIVKSTFFTECPWATASLRTDASMMFFLNPFRTHFSFFFNSFAEEWETLGRKEALNNLVY